MSREGIDEAFAVIGDTLVAYTSLESELVDHEAGVRMSIQELAVETPIELSLYVDEAGRVEIGCVPPLYDVDVTISPVFHQLRFRAVVDHSDDHEEPTHG